jgi:hypothetical protein
MGATPSANLLTYASDGRRGAQAQAMNPWGDGAGAPGVKS